MRGRVEGREGGREEGRPDALPHPPSQRVDQAVCGSLPGSAWDVIALLPAHKCAPPPSLHLLPPPAPLVALMAEREEEVEEGEGEGSGEEGEGAVRPAPPDLVSSGALRF